MKIFNKNGFTLIEVLLVIAILAILASIVIIAINPGKQFAAARDAQRQSDVFSIMNALHQYALDHEGAFPQSVTTDEKEVCRTDSESCTDLIDLSPLTSDQTYLVEMPMDPQCPVSDANCSENGTGYYVSLSSSGRVTVTAYGAENGDISVTR
jgi:prepilin-type N-terminal cleavage/methylation domain-containing protein